MSGGATRNSRTSAQHTSNTKKLEPHETGAAPDYDGDDEDSSIGTPTGLSSSRITTAAASSPNSIHTAIVHTRDEEVARADKHHIFHSFVVCPLANLGNTCYFNAGVQLLACCGAFKYALHTSCFHLRGKERSAELLCAGSAAGHRFLMALSQLVFRMEYEDLSASKMSAISPNVALDAIGEVFPMFAGRAQQDCPEMIAVALNNIEDEGRQVGHVDVMLASFARDAKTAITTSASPRDAEEGEEDVPMISGDANAAPPVFSPATAQTSPREGAATTTTTTSLQKQEHMEQMSSTPGYFGSHIITLLRIMSKSYEDSLARERRVAQRRGKNFDPRSVPRPNIVMNPITDGFKGHTLSEVVCGSCEAVSRTVQPFFSLIVEVPSIAQRRKYAEAHVSDASRKSSSSKSKRRTGAAACRLRWLNPLQWLWWLWSCLVLRQLDAPLTLRECIGIHYEPCALTGANRYHCESCGKKSNAIKRESILVLPEYLLIHMKRADRGGFFMIKNGQEVDFPTNWKPWPATTTTTTTTSSSPSSSPATSASPTSSAVKGAHPLTEADIPDFLDLREHMAAEVLPYVQALPPGMARGAAASPLASSGSEHGYLTTTYTLDGVVNHHGSFGGGHYTVFAFKGSETLEAQGVWLHMSDDAIHVSNATEVANSEEYVLLYRKQRVVKMPDTAPARVLQALARYYLVKPQLSMSDEDGPRRPDVAFISRAWVQRAAFFHDPGPIMNDLCYCDAAARAGVTKYNRIFDHDARVAQDVPHVHGPPVEWAYIGIDVVDYERFFNAFGGNAALTAAEVKELHAQQMRFEAVIVAQRTQEGDTVVARANNNNNNNNVAEPNATGHHHQSSEVSEHSNDVCC